MNKDLTGLPGGDLVEKGLRDISTQTRSEESLLLMVASPRLRGLGISFANLEGLTEPYEHRLYEMLEERHSRGAHSAYNALVRKIVSFANAYYQVVVKPTNQ